MLKGILIFATRHVYYGRMAYNLAVSIKVVEPSMPIAVCVTDGALSHLSAGQQCIFDHIIDLPPEAPDTCGCKLWADKVTPFERTLLLDADMLWLPNRTPSQLFDEAGDVGFTGVAEGYHTYGGHDHEPHERYFFWAQPQEIGAVYELPEGRKIYQWRSETLVFTADAAPMFALARQVYLNPRLSTLKAYGAGVADELGINVACAVQDIHPHTYRWQPAYWHMMNNQRFDNVQRIYDTYYLATFGSNMANTESRAFYDKLMKYYCMKQGITHVFPLHSKRDYMPERVKI